MDGQGTTREPCFGAATPKTADGSRPPGHNLAAGGKHRAVVIARGKRMTVDLGRTPTARLEAVKRAIERELERRAGLRCLAGPLWDFRPNGPENRTEERTRP